MEKSKSSILLNNSIANIGRRESTTSYNDNISYTMGDLYDDASAIGNEIENIIKKYGVDSIKDLMPRIINALELLENFTGRRDKDFDSIVELRTRITQLETEKMNRLNEKDKFERELQEIEDNWKQESLKLIDMVNKLKVENKRLAELAHDNSTSDQSNKFIIKQEELDFIRSIKEENMAMKDSLRFAEKEADERRFENEALQSQIESLSETILKFRRKQIVAQNQIEKLVKVKTDLECSLSEKDQKINALNRQIKDYNLNLSDHNEMLRNSNEKNTKSDAEKSETIRKLSSSMSNNDLNKKMIVIDSTDPNRPRFTLKELQKVLMEKNELTVKLDQTIDELQHLKQ
jgi:RILP-like protein 1